MRNDSEALFAQANWSVTDTLTFTGGLRYTRETRSILTRNHVGGPLGDIAVPVASINAAGPFPIAVPAPPYTRCDVPAAVLTTRPNPATGQFGVCEGFFSNKYSNLSWLMSVDWAMTDQTLLYAKASKGFRAGGQQSSGSFIPSSWAPFDPEVAVTYESGLKSTFWDGRARVNANVYYTDYDNIQRSFLQFVPELNNNATITKNAAKAHMYGVEIEATLVPVRNLTLSGTLGTINAKFDKYIEGNIDRTDQRFNTRSHLPKYNLSLGARYVVELEPGDLTFNLNYAYEARSVTYLAPFSPTPGVACCNVIVTAASAQTLPGYGLLNGRITFNFEELGAQVAVWGNNLADKAVPLPGQDLQGLGFRTYYVQDPRTIGVTVSKRFGGG